MGKPLIHLFGDDADARRFNRQISLCLALLYAQFSLVLAGWLPGWTMFLTAPVLVVRWMLSMHEIFHLRNEREVGAPTRLLLLMLTLFFLGYREMRVIHLGHHRYMATPQVRISSTFAAASCPASSTPFVKPGPMLHSPTSPER